MTYHIKEFAIFGAVAVLSGYILMTGMISASVMFIDWVGAL